MIQNKAFNETNAHRQTDNSQGDGCNTAALNSQLTDEALIGVICPNCGARLEGRKCKLFCSTSGCGYLITCSEW